MRNNVQNKRMRNRNRKPHNPSTRVLESNGPDVKIRGTASHIAEKYVQLARDAQSSGDYVAAENYYQHAEHYFRIIAASQEQLRQNQPYSARDQDMRDDGDDDGDHDGESYANEPGYVSREQPPSFPHRETQREPQRESHREAQPYQKREHFQPRPAPQPQPQPQPDMGADIERLPSFITGAQPVVASNGEERSPGESRFPRRRRRHPGPRGSDNVAPGIGDDVVAPGAE